ncbi:MAG: hypothetical protein AAGK04_07455 [Planctomycetota bacterium]
MRIHTTRTKTLRGAGAASLALIAFGMTAGGCIYHGPKSSEGNANKIRYNLTPELWTTYERPADVRNHLAYQSNANIRLLRADLGRAAMTDRPSRLTPEPVPY